MHKLTILTYTFYLPQVYFIGVPHLTSFMQLERFSSFQVQNFELQYSISDLKETLPTHGAYSSMMFYRGKRVVCKRLPYRSKITVTRELLLDFKYVSWKDRLVRKSDSLKVRLQHLIFFNKRVLRCYFFQFQGNTLMMVVVELI